MIDTLEGSEYASGGGPVEANSNSYREINNKIAKAAPLSYLFYKFKSKIVTSI